MKRNLVCTLLLVLFASVLVFLWSFTAPVPVKNDVRAILSDDYFDWYRNEARHSWRRAPPVRVFPRPRAGVNARCASGALTPRMSLWYRKKENVSRRRRGDT